MKNLKPTIIFITVSVAVFLFSCGNNASNSTNSVEPTSEQTTSTEAEVKIGTQTWSTKNLDVSTFRNGEIIPEAKTNEEWEKAGEDGKPAWCYYDNDPENGKKYGKLYNWYAVNDPRGLSPKGWHVPTDSEWTTLTDYLGGKEVAGAKMKSTSGWNNYGSKTGNGTNQSGFAGSPDGYRSNGGRFAGIGKDGAWWSSSESSTGLALSCSLTYGSDDVYRVIDGESGGVSVRCVRDK